MKPDKQKKRENKEPWSLIEINNLKQYEAYVKSSLVDENPFISMKPEKKELPVFKESKHLLPKPFWDNHESVLECYQKTWEIAFSNLRQPTEENGFISNYIDTAFNDCLFMWDSAFILLFAKYGSRAFNFQCTLDNLYAKQHPDGFICREIDESDGNDRFNRYDPSSTGPNIMPWTEWQYYSIFGDKDRLRNVFPVLAAYHRWLRSYRTWPDGTYWSTGWGCGMDNQPRMDKSMSQEFYHGHLTWIDTCMQQLLCAKIITRMSEILGRRNETDDFVKETQYLTKVINEKLWDENDGFYYDMKPCGNLSKVKTIGSYWALLADVVPGGRIERFVYHLDNPKEFKRPHRVPSLSADHPLYDKEGDYWRGSIWTPTNYMVLCGLAENGYNTLAHDIAKNHLDNVVKVFEDTGTLWENYAPEHHRPGSISRKDFVGWSGLPPIAVLFEYVFGIKPDVKNSKLVWDVRLKESHGIKNYPFGDKGILDLHCEDRSSINETPVIKAFSDIPVTLEIKWEKGRKTIRL